MIISAQHVSDAHIPVVNDDAKIIGGRAVGASDDQIVKLGVFKTDGALDQVDPSGCAVLGAFEAHHGFAPDRDGGQDFASFGAPRAVVARLETLGPR